MKKYLVFVIQAYEKEENGILINNCELQLMDETYEKALERAKQLIKKPNYILKQVLENYVK